MSKGTGWIPLDKNLSQYLNAINREYSFIEAMFSYTLDMDKGRKGTISGYAKLWGWSRNKARRLVNCIRTDEGHVRDSKRTHEGHPIHFIDKALWDKKDSKKTGEGQVEDTPKDTTVNPIILDPKSETISSGEQPPAKRVKKCPQQKIVSLWNSLMPECPQVRSWVNESNQKSLRTRWNEDSDRQELEWWTEFFNYIRLSDFLMGRKTDFSVSLDWLVGPKNFQKVINGNYENRDNNKEYGQIINACDDFVNNHKTREEKNAINR